MPAGPEFLTFQSNVTVASGHVSTVRQDAEAFVDAMQPAAAAAKGYLNFKRIIKLSDSLIEDALRSLELAEKAGPVSAPAKLLKDTLEAIQPRVEALKEKTENARLLNDVAKLTSDAYNVLTGQDGVLEKLAAADLFLVNVVASTEEVVEGFAVVDQNGSGTEFNDLSGRLDTYVAPINSVADGTRDVLDLFDDFEGINVELDEVIDLLSVADFGEIASKMVDLVDFEDELAFLADIMDKANFVLRPLEPLLDAIGEVTERLERAFDYLTEELGLDRILDALADQITSLFPDIDLFDEFLEQANAITDDLTDFIDTDFGITGYTENAIDLFDRFEESFLDNFAGPAFRIGTYDDPETSAVEGNDNNNSGGAGRIVGTGAAEVFDGRGGDDDIVAGSGDDMIIASAGQDTVDGGAGTDTLVFSGKSVEYDISRSEDTGDGVVFTFTHSDVAPGSRDDGVEVATNIEFFDFEDRRFTAAELETALIAPSVIDRNARVPGAPGADEDELIFLQQGGTRRDVVVDGITFEDVNVVFGYGGDDRIQGTTAPIIETIDRPGFLPPFPIVVPPNDYINGGEGDDFILPRNGEDVIDGGPGLDTVFFADLGRRGAFDIDLTIEGRNNFVNTEKHYFTRVENFIFHDAANIMIRTDAADNIIATGAGDDIHNGYHGNDKLLAGDGQDVLFGGLGIDSLYGGAQNDALIVLDSSDQGGSEHYDGGEGRDILSYGLSEAPIDAVSRGSQSTFNQRAKDHLRQDGVAFGSVVVRALEGEVDRLDESGEFIATDSFVDIERIYGSNGDDRMFGGVDPRLCSLDVFGANGNDTLFSGGASASGGGGNDTVVATFGDFRVPGSKSLHGDAGDDTLDLTQAGNVRWSLQSSSSGNLSVYALEGGFTGDLSGTVGNQPELVDVLGASGFETILGGDRDDYFHYVIDNDTLLVGGAGDDVFFSAATGRGTNVTRIEGGSGNDTIAFERKVGDASGGNGNDRFSYNNFGQNLATNTTADGGADNDHFTIIDYGAIVEGGTGFDTLYLAPTSGGVSVDAASGQVTSGNGRISTTFGGIEQIITTDNADTAFGSGNDDRIVLNGGNDRAEGRDGNDQLFGGDGNDTLEGNAGDDVLVGGAGQNMLNGGSGTDAASYAIAMPTGTDATPEATLFEGVTARLDTGLATRGGQTDTLISIEDLYGTILADTLVGDDQNNLLFGGGGSDTLDGGGGDDILMTGGGSLSDAADQMSGGSGDDVFVLGTGTFDVDGGSGRDRLDFSAVTDTAEGGGRTVSLIIDLRNDRISREIEVGTLVWADDGTQSTRSFDGQSIRPEDVLRSDPNYARSASDLDLRLPTGEEDNADIPSFAIQVQPQTITRASEDSTVRNVEDVVGTAEKDFITGNDADNRFWGGDGDDVLRGREGNDSLDGGAGRDAVYFSGNQARYTLALSSDGLVVTDRRGDNGSDTLTSIELLDFEIDIFDGLFDLEIFGRLAELAAAALESFIELYIAYFNRAPDAVGLAFWGTAFANGTTLEESAALFIDQDETRSIYPENLSNRDFATAVYNNVLGRVPDEDGFNFWVDVLDGGSVGRDQFILAVLRGAKADPPDGASQAFIDQQLADRAYLEAKTDIGTYFAVTLGMSDVDNASAAMALFDGSEASIAQTVAAIDGYFTDASDADTGEFLMPLVGVIDDPFA
jgi:Ca2+-binding RTX toxin-like protein